LHKSSVFAEKSLVEGNELIGFVLKITIEKRLTKMAANTCICDTKVQPISFNFFFYLKSKPYLSNALQGQ